MMNTVAIVEDDRLFNEALYQILKKAGYETARAYSYGEGLALIEKTPDLMIVDVNLPGGEGFELCRRARDYGQIPVIFLTARDEETDMIKAFDLGADDYLVKPFPMAVLLKHVEAVLRRSSSEKDVLSYMDLQIDFQRKSVSYKGAEIKLTAREGAFVEENTVNVTLSRLRKKIEPEPASPIFIRNVFGMGYTFGK